MEAIQTPIEVVVEASVDGSWRKLQLVDRSWCKLQLVDGSWWKLPVTPRAEGSRYIHGRFLVWTPVQVNILPRELAPTSMETNYLLPPKLARTSMEVPFCSWSF